MKLLVVIPALNEEASIREIIERSLVARDVIVRTSPVTTVDITVVSDGSTDRTVERAAAFGERIRLLVFPENRGYGAAIKAAWRESDADLLGVLDADGTCDPEAFAPLCAQLLATGADVAVGCRLNAESRMPLVRRVGNVLFAVLLSAVSSERVRDVSSGMRVVRRSSLPRLLPLPDGMHFTPAMSARTILGRDLALVEVQIPYHERTGRSKLHVVRDGFRFLRVIVEAALVYRPFRPLALFGIACGAVAFGLIAMPTVYYLHHRSVAEWMIYRFVVSSLMASSACLLLTSAYLVRKIVTIVLSDGVERPAGPIPTRLHGLLFWAVPVALLAVSVGLVMPSLVELVRSGSTYEHWSRFIAMSCLASCALILVVARIVDYCLELLSARVAYLRNAADTSAAGAADGQRPTPAARTGRSG
jgi:glycosyltransferase involved in cell wall biosynthesis